MALKRKPLENKGKPEYPQSDEYAADRRGFLMMVGAAAVAASGVLILRETGSLGPKSNPGANVMGGIRAPTNPPVNRSGPVKVINRPQASSGGKPMPPQPNALPAQPATGQPPRAQPQASFDGDVAVPNLPRPQANPQAPVPGGIRAPMNIVPDANPKGLNISPRASIKGRVMAPRWVKKDSSTKTKTKIFKTPVAPPTEEDF